MAYFRLANSTISRIFCRFGVLHYTEGICPFYFVRLRSEKFRMWIFQSNSVGDRPFLVKIKTKNCGNLPTNTKKTSNSSNSVALIIIFELKCKIIPQLKYLVTWYVKFYNRTNFWTYSTLTNRIVPVKLNVRNHEFSTLNSRPLINQINQCVRLHRTINFHPFHRSTRHTFDYKPKLDHQRIIPFGIETWTP